MYVNGENPRFNPHRQFAFLRKHAHELLVIIVNFDSRPAAVEVNIPPHAFDFMGITPGEYAATELISGDKTEKTVSPETPFVSELTAYGAVVWKIALKKIPGKVKKNKMISK